MTQSLTDLMGIYLYEGKRSGTRRPIFGRNGYDGSHYHRGGPSMDTRTLLLLTIVALIVGYVAYRDPEMGSAVGVAVVVVGLLAYFIKEDDSKKQ